MRANGCIDLVCGKEIAFAQCFCHDIAACEAAIIDSKPALVIILAEQLRQIGPDVVGNGMIQRFHLTSCVFCQCCQCLYGITVKGTDTFFDFVC